MAQGDTDVTICNKALLLLGSDGFTSMNDGTLQANACSQMYEEIKMLTCGLYPWSFTLAKVQLVRDSATPQNEWTYQYRMPNDMINNVPRAVRTTSSPGGPLITSFELGQSTGGYQVLMTEATEIHIDYQKAISEGAMPKYFVQLLVYQVAWHLAEVITDQVTKSQYWRQVAIGMDSESGRGGYLRQAMNIDASGQNNSIIGQYMLTDVRS